MASDSGQSGPASRGTAAAPREEVETRALLRILAAQSQNANPIVALTAVVMIFTMYGSVDRNGLLTWATLTFLVAVIRHRMSRQIRERASTSDLRQLHRDERLTLVGMACSSVVMGSAFWLIAVHGDQYARMIVTLISLMHMTAVLLFLTRRLVDRLTSSIGNIVQGALFWLGLGTGEPPRWEVLVVYCGLFWCSLVFGREQLRQFRESLRVRDENAALLDRLAVEHATVEQALEDARQANASKSRFMAAASHDLRQPLHALTMFLGTLGFHVSGEDGRRLLGRATDTLRVLEEQFNSLIDLSRFDAGAVTANSRIHRLDELLHKIVDEFRPQAEGKGLELTLTTVPALVLSDPLLLGRLLRNLLDNAVHYTPSGAVAVRLQRVADRFTLTVQDTGPGIALDEQARIFDEYVQLDNPGRQRQHGVGLGLAIVKRIDQLLGLQLRLQSTVGAGSCFALSVPAADANSAVSAGAEVPSTALAYRTSVRVWVLDDDPVVLEGLEAQLQAWGATVTCFADPAQLLAEWRRGAARPDWLLTDDMLGTQMSGLELARLVLRESATIRVALVTGNTEPLRLAQLRSSGLPVIVKPATPERLIALLGGATADAFREAPSAV
jgi:signal transduction histidine kinase